MTLSARFSSLEILEVGQVHTSCPFAILTIQYILLMDSISRESQKANGGHNPLVVFLYLDRYALSRSSMYSFQPVCFMVF